jgi:small-conductance mechanosensitive channel
VRLDRAHFTGVGPSAMNFEVVYFYDSPDYLAFMDVQQEIALQMVERFDAEGIEFAYPTQTLQVRNGGAAKEVPGTTPGAGPTPASS